MRKAAEEGIKQAEEKKAKLKEEKARKKKTPCKNFASGTCKFGDKCAYRHGETGGAAEEIDEDIEEEEFDDDVLGDSHCFLCTLSSESDLVSPIGHNTENQIHSLMTPESKPKLSTKQNIVHNQLHSEASVRRPARVRGAVNGWVVDCNIAGAALATKLHILDPGASLHIIRYQRGMRMKKGPLVRIQTANGIVTTNKYVSIEIPKIGVVDCVVLKDTPNLISMGKLLKQFGLRFDWDSSQYDSPFLENKQTGEKVFLCIDKETPVFEISQRTQVSGPARERLTGKQTVEPDFVIPSPYEEGNKKTQQCKNYLKSITHFQCGCDWCKLATQKRRQSQRNKIPAPRARKQGEVTLTDTYEPTMK